MKHVCCIIIFAVISHTCVSVFGNTTESKKLKNWKSLKVLATAYCPCRKCCGKYADGVTAIGKNASTKGIAVDKEIIPLRSIVQVPGYGTVMADDVGGAIKKKHIDIRFNSHKEALNWGRKYITVKYRVP